MKSISIKLEINEKEVTISHDLLEKIIEQIPDIPQNKDIFEILSKSDNSEVKSLLTKKRFLNKKTISLLLNDKSKKVVINLIYNQHLTKKITTKQIIKIIKRNNIDILCAIATHLRNFTLINKYKLASRLSNDKNSSVRYSLVSNSRLETISTSTLKKLSRDKDSFVAFKAMSRLKKRLTSSSDCDCSTEICFCDF